MSGFCERCDHPLPASADTDASSGGIRTGGWTVCVKPGPASTMSVGTVAGSADEGGSKGTDVKTYDYEGYSNWTAHIAQAQAKAKSSIERAPTVTDTTPWGEKLPACCVGVKPVDAGRYLLYYCREQPQTPHGFKKPEPTVTDWGEKKVVTETQPLPDYKVITPRITTHSGSHYVGYSASLDGDGNINVVFYDPTENIVLGDDFSEAGLIQGENDDQLDSLRDDIADMQDDINNLHTLLLEECDHRRKQQTQLSHLATRLEALEGQHNRLVGQVWERGDTLTAEVIRTDRLEDRIRDLEKQCQR